MLANVNYLPVIVAALIHMAIGFVWYSPRFFGNTWAKLMGWPLEAKEDKGTGKEQKKGMFQTYTLSFLSALIMAYMLSSLIALTRMRAIFETMELAALIWLGFVATTTFTNSLFTGKSKKLWLIDYGYVLVSLIIMSILFTFWR